jgi:hypothetical protein
MLAPSKFQLTSLQKEAFSSRCQPLYTSRIDSHRLVRKQQVPWDHAKHSAELETAHLEPKDKDLQVYQCSSKSSWLYLGSRSY